MATPPTASCTLPRRDVHLAPLHDRVELTPGGHRMHSLQSTSPGGTTRTAHYVSPLKGDSSVDNDDEILEADGDVERDQYFRRCDALAEVHWRRFHATRQSDTQRTAVARAKRKAGVPAAPQAKRSNRKPWGAVQKERHDERLAACGGVLCGGCGTCHLCRFGRSY